MYLPMNKSNANVSQAPIFQVWSQVSPFLAKELKFTLVRFCFFVCFAGQKKQEDATVWSLLAFKFLSFTHTQSSSVFSCCFKQVALTEIEILYKQNFKISRGAFGDQTNTAELEQWLDEKPTILENCHQTKTGCIVITNNSLAFLNFPCTFVKERINY